MKLKILRYIEIFPFTFLTFSVQSFKSYTSAMARALFKLIPAVGHQFSFHTKKDTHLMGQYFTVLLLKG